MKRDRRAFVFDSRAVDRSENVMDTNEVRSPVEKVFHVSSHYYYHSIFCAASASPI